MVGLLRLAYIGMQIIQWLWEQVPQMSCLLVHDRITLTLTVIVTFPLRLGVLVDLDHLDIDAVCPQETAGTTIVKGGGGHGLTQGTEAGTGRGRGNETGTGSGNGKEIGRGKETGRGTKIGRGTGRGRETGTGRRKVVGKEKERGTERKKGT